MFGEQLGDIAFGVVAVAEDARVGRAGFDAGGHFAVGEAVVAEGAFLDNAFWPDAGVGFGAGGIVGAYLWINEDGDGIPNAWEEANGMSDNDADDADLDVDGDGFSAKDEYLAGTDPRDAASVLKIGEIARQTTPDGTSTLVSWASVADRRYRVE